MFVCMLASCGMMFCSWGIMRYQCLYSLHFCWHHVLWNDRNFSCLHHIFMLASSSDNVGISLFAKVQLWIGNMFFISCSCSFGSTHAHKCISSLYETVKDDRRIKSLGIAEVLNTSLDTFNALLGYKEDLDEWISPSMIYAPNSSSSHYPPQPLPLGCVHSFV